MQRRFEFVPLVALLLAAGCHHYVEVPRSTIARGDAVRVTLTRDAVESIARNQDLPGLRGRVDAEVQDAGDGEVLGILVRRRDASPADRSGLGAYLEVPWTAIERVEEKRLSTRRTVGVAAVAGVATALILSQAVGGTGSGEGEPPINERVGVTLFRLIFR